MPDEVGLAHPGMQDQLLEAALGIAKPWYVRGVDFDAARKVLTIGIDFVAGRRFPAPGVEGAHPIDDTQTKQLRHLNFFQYECYLEVRTPRVKLPDGRGVPIEPDWFGKLSGITLLFKALGLGMAQLMIFAAVARLVNESWHRAHAICSRYVDPAVTEADLSRVVAVAIDETACRRGHDYLTIAADAEERKVVFVTEGRDATTVARFAESPGHPQNAARADRRGGNRRGAGLHGGPRRPLAQRSHHRRQIPCRRPRLHRRRPDQAPRTAARSEPQRTALDGR